MEAEPPDARDYLAAAERAAASVPGAAPGDGGLHFERACVVGAGTMGAGIAVALASGGLAVRLLDANPAALERAERTIDGLFDASVRKGRLTAGEAQTRRARIAFTSDLAQAARDVDVAVEAVFEDVGVKREVFARLDAVAPPRALLASNTSTLDIDTLAAVTSRPQRMLGWHFFSPAHVMRLLEIVRGAATAPEAVVASLALAARIGKVGVVARTCDGFIGNRMLAGYRRETYLLLEDGALPQDVDAALVRFGFAMGPFAVYDLAGLDIGWHVKRRRVAEGRTRGIRESELLDRLCERGRFGQKTGAGVYRYCAGERAPRPDPEVEALIAAESAHLGIVRRTVEPDEIVLRCLLPLVDEGARILADGTALRPGDVDLVWVYGYGFPAARGGPLHWADGLGLANVVARMRAFVPRLGSHWEPAPLMRALARAGRTFASLAPEEAAELARAEQAV